MDMSHPNLKHMLPRRRDLHDRDDQNLQMGTTKLGIAPEKLIRGVTKLTQERSRQPEYEPGRVPRAGPVVDLEHPEFRSRHLRHYPV